MTQISSRIETLEPSPIVTFIGLANQYKNNINFVSGSPGHGSIPGIQSAINQASTRAVSLYRAPHYGSPQARADAVRYFQQCYGIAFDPDQEINITTGFTHLFFCLCTTLLNPGDSVLLIEPSFPQYQQPIKLAGGQIFTIPTTEEDLWKPTPEAIQAAFSRHPQAKLIIFNYPNNPSGATLTDADWHPIIDCLSQEVQRRSQANTTPLLVLSDDAYVPLFHEQVQAQQSTATLAGTLQKRLNHATAEESAQLTPLMNSLLIACTLSKQGSAGTLLGMGASKNATLLKFMRVPQKATVICPNAMGEVALHALVQGDSHATLPWARNLYASRLEQLGQGLNAIWEKVDGEKVDGEKVDLSAGQRAHPLVATIPVAGMYCYANFSRLKGIKVSPEFLAAIQPLIQENPRLTSLFQNGKIHTNLDVAVWLLLDAQVSTIPMGPAEKCCVRFSVSLPQAMVEKSPQAIDRSRTESEGRKIIDQALQQIAHSLQKLTA